ncbi:(d)CMP kinase [Candidatus Mycoplasma pogonae]
MKKINIAIDGPSGAGKSSVAKKIAKALDYYFVNTGSLYRAIAWWVLENQLDLKNEHAIEKLVLETKLEFDINDHFFINGQNVTDFLRNDTVALASSTISQYQNIRKKVVQILKKFTENNKGIIMDGRDTTFVVMPEAELKIFLWAAPEIRAMRRVKQNQLLNLEQDYDVVLSEIKHRDFQDMNRKINPLHKTDDAYLVDSTNLSEEEVFKEIIKLVKLKAV